jgi:putative DNA primase/helicase
MVLNIEKAVTVKSPPLPEDAKTGEPSRAYDSHDRANVPVAAPNFKGFIMVQTTATILFLPKWTSGKCMGRMRTHDAMPNEVDFELKVALIRKRAEYLPKLGKVEETEIGWRISSFEVPRNHAAKPRNLRTGAVIGDLEFIRVYCGINDLDKAKAHAAGLIGMAWPGADGGRQQIGNGEDRTAGQQNEAEPKPNHLLLSPGSPLPSAEEFVRRHHIHDGIRTLHCFADEFFTYNAAGSHYRRLEPAAMRKGLYDFLGIAKRVDEKGKIHPFNPNRTKVNDVLDAVKAVAHLSESAPPPLWLGQPMVDFPAPEILAAKNGLLHLPTLTLLLPTARFFNVNALDYAYDGNAPEPGNWLAFLKSIWPNDEESISTLQEIAGYLLTGDTRQQKGFLLIGPRRCGKGTMGRAFRRMIGAHNVCGPTLASFKEPFGMETLLDKLLAVISDARLGTGIDHQIIVERLLNITGEDPLSIPRKYLRDVTTILPTRILILTNELPRFADASGTLASRFIVLVMTKSFYGTEDHGLDRRLSGELSGILNWAIKGWQRLQQRGYFAPPDSAAKIVEQFEELGSPTKAFIKECCDLGTGFAIDKASLFQAWRRYCTDHGIDHPGTDAVFGKNLIAAEPSITTSQPRAKDGTRMNSYQGIRLKVRE